MNVCIVGAKQLVAAWNCHYIPGKFMLLEGGKFVLLSLEYHGFKWDSGGFNNSFIPIGCITYKLY